MEKVESDGEFYYENVNITQRSWGNPMENCTMFEEKTGDRWLQGFTRPLDTGEKDWKSTGKAIGAAWS